MNGALHLDINPACQVDIQPVAEGLVCVVVDDFLLNADEVARYALTHRDRLQPQPGGYPGSVMPLDEQGLVGWYRFFRSTLSRELGFCRSGIDFNAQFALTTLQPEKFSWIQRLCHTDPHFSPGKAHYAGLIYLFHDPALGGTAFYRWREPDLWPEMMALQQRDPGAAKAMLEQKLPMFREPPRYITHSNEAAELLHRVDARFNRFVCYSGDIPHSAWIEDASLLVDDPETGRLTLNCYTGVVPRS